MCVGALCPKCPRHCKGRTRPTPPLLQYGLRGKLAAYETYSPSGHRYILVLSIPRSLADLEYRTAYEGPLSPRDDYGHALVPCSGKTYCRANRRTECCRPPRESRRPVSACACVRHQASRRTSRSWCRLQRNDRTHSNLDERSSRIACLGIAGVAFAFSTAESLACSAS